MVSLAEQIKELRTSRNLLQQTLADELGLSLRGYQRYERGEREPSASTLVALADYFNVSLDYLVGRSDEPELIRKDDNNDIRAGNPIKTSGE